MATNNQLKIVFYGDDITGSTDAMEALILAGVPTVLFFEPPSAAQLREDYPDIQAVGLAGMSRTMTPVEMDASLPGAFHSLKALGAAVTHYKICSTFDSSPEIGSIGRALDIGAALFQPAFVPVVVGAPKLKRFVVFGNLFATVDETTYRIDRHPVMSRHPITPMDEADLRFHLGRQTSKRIGLLDIRHLQQADQAIDRAVQQKVEEGFEIIVLDTIDQTHLLKTGRLLSALGEQQQSFVVGSSGVEFALTEWWRSTGQISARQEFSSPGAVEQVVGLSGSASPWNASQMRWAFDHGFTGLSLDSARLVDPDVQHEERERVIGQALALIGEGKSVILHSAIGPDDPRITAAKEKAQSLGFARRDIGELLARQQGIILKDILKQSGLRRAAVAGGDTCGHVLQELTIYVLEFIIPLGVAAPLCRARAHDPAFDGLEISLKGGQMSDIQFFGRLRNGGAA